MALAYVRVWNAVLHGNDIAGNGGEILLIETLLSNRSQYLVVGFLSECSPNHALTAPVTAAKLARVSPLNLMPRKFWIRPCVLDLMRKWSHRVVKSISIRESYLIFCPGVDVIVGVNEDFGPLED